MSLPLEGKVAIVTGGSRGIGAAIVARLAKDGADVAFSYSNSKERALQVAAEVESYGRKVIAFKADQASSTEVQAFIQTVQDTFGRIDILINSAGVFVTGVIGDPQTDYAALDKQLDVNVKGVVSAVRAAVPLMKDGGRIISIGTTGADHIPFPGAADYVATKAAVAAYTRGWARDLGPRNITVNVVQPGAMPTDMMVEALGSTTAPDAFLDMHPIRRIATLEEVSALVGFLAGPDAGYMSGGVIDMAGGLAI
jgi:3-oxoacyl-[acyl-carrier protein] reductase